MMSRTDARRRLPLPGLGNFSAGYLLVVIFVLFGLWIPQTFLTQITFQLTLSNQVIVGIVGLALLIPLVSGTFDLSTASMVGFSSVIVSRFAETGNAGPVVACVVAVLACAVMGVLTGIIVVVFRVDSFIATLGTSQVLLALSLFISQNRVISGVFSAKYLAFARQDLFGIQAAFYYLIALALIIWIVLDRTPLGRNLFAVGANHEAARLAGIRADRLVFGTLVASATVAGFGGVVYTAQVGNYSNAFSAPLLFPAFAAVFFGATQLKQRPNVWGTILALYTLAFGVKGIQLAFASGVYWITPIFNGIALVVAVAFARRNVAATLRRKRVSRKPPPRSDVQPDDAIRPQEVVANS